MSFFRQPVNELSAVIARLHPRRVNPFPHAILLDAPVDFEISRKSVFEDFRHIRFALRFEIEIFPRANAIRAGFRGKLDRKILAELKNRKLSPVAFIQIFPPRRRLIFRRQIGKLVINGF